MNIVIINGSPRSEGSTAALLRMIEARLLSHDDVVIDYFDVGSMNLQHCMGCSRCFRTGECYIDDDAERISNAISEASAVIIGTPTYASNVSGVLKTFIDRGHFVIEQLLKDKYTLGVVTGENYGASDAARIIRSLFSYSGGLVSGVHAFKLPFSSSPKLDESTISRIEKSADRLYRDLVYRRTYPFQRLTHFVVFTIGIKPFVHKKGDAYAGVTARWNDKLTTVTTADR